MKKVIEKVVNQNQNIVEYITRLASESKTWIFVSEKLYYELQKEYRFQPFRKGDGTYIFDTNEKNINIKNKKDNAWIYWKEVVSISEKGVYTYPNGDPEVIYFLS